MTYNKRTCKFITFNCRSIKRSIEGVRLLCQSADIIALQETWLLPMDIPFLGKISQDFEYTGKSAVDLSQGMLKGRPYGGVAILWRKQSFDSVRVVDCDSVRLTGIEATADDKRILVFSVYMPVDSNDNLIEFTECLSKIRAIVETSAIENVYILGDFNAHPGELFGCELIDFCAEQNWRCADMDKLGANSDTHTYISDSLGCKRWLDHCVVTQSAWQTVIDVGVVNDVFWSDHFPTYIKCELNIIKTKSAITNVKCNNNKVVWGERKCDQIDEYTILCNDKLQLIECPPALGLCIENHCNDLNHHRYIDDMYASIVCILSESAVLSHRGPEMRKHRARIIGWNRHVRNAHREARLGYKNWLWHNKPPSGHVYDEMHAARKVFKAKLKWCQNNQEQIQLDILALHRKNNDFKQFWKSTSKFDTKPGLPTCVGEAHEPASIANMFVKHFQVESPLGSPQRVVDAGGCSDSDLIRFSAKQVAEAIGRMTRGKSPGHDGLSIEHLQCAGVQLPKILGTFYSLCMSHSYLPHNLMRTIVVPIIKNKTGDVGDKSNYRPISLATVMAKVLDSLLEARLENFLKLHDGQFGFRPGLSTESAVLCLKSTVQYYTQRSTPVYACFLDLSKAFDLVSYDLLWKKLREREVPAELLRIFQFWYYNQTNSVRWADQLSETYVVNCGVRQGGITSPKLFNLYMDELIVELSSKRLGCRIDGVSFNNLSYADDMVLLSPTIRALRELLKSCELYAQFHGLSYNVKKSELMVFNATGGRCPKIIPAVKLKGSALNLVDKFKYLGHYVTKDLKDHDDMERERRALAVRCNLLVRRFGRCSKDVKISLFKAYCQVFYTCSLWTNSTQRATNALRVQYNNGFRMLMGLPGFCSASGMFAEARVDDYYAVVRKRAASLLCRIRASSNNILKVLADRFDVPILNCCASKCKARTMIVTKL